MLDTSYRNDEGAPPARDGRYHLGDTEWRDVESAVQLALDAGATDVVLMGASMGGALVTQMMDRSPLADRVRALALDAPVLDWREVLRQQARLRHLPESLGEIAGALAFRRIGADLGAFDQVERSERFAVPVWLAHGEADDVVPIVTSRAFAATRPDLVTTFFAPGAGHVQSWNVDPAAYEDAFGRWLATVTGEQEAAASPGCRSPSGRRAPASDGRRPGAGGRPRRTCSRPPSGPPASCTWCCPARSRR